MTHKKNLAKILLTSAGITLLTLGCSSKKEESNFGYGNRPQLAYKTNIDGTEVFLYQSKENQKPRVMEVKSGDILYTYFDGDSDPDAEWVERKVGSMVLHGDSNSDDPILRSLYENGNTDYQTKSQQIQGEIIDEFGLQASP